MSLIAIAFVVLSLPISIVIPWLGVLSYYMFSIMQMQSLWPQAFGTIRVQLYMTAATVLGLAFSTVQRKINWRVLFMPLNLVMILLAIIINLSAHYNVFNDHVITIRGVNESDLVSSEQVLSVFNKTLFFYLIATLLIDTRQKLEWCIYMLIGILLFYTFSANKIYFTGEFWRFGDNGRLGGPVGTVYIDENYFGMLFVIATPILYYLGVIRENIIMRYGIWVFIPITWHALFLTSSRGGFLALSVTCLYIFFRSFNKSASVLLVLGLVVAVTFQSGQLLNRVDTTIETNEILVGTNSEQKLDPRLISWSVGAKIVRDYPLFGAGVGNFMKAYPLYDASDPRVAHNTFFQFSANCGIGAGLIYLWLFVRRIPTVKRSVDINDKRNFPGGFKRDYLDDLLNSLFLSVFIISIFLDLMIYEILYFLFLLSFCKYRLDKGNSLDTGKELPKQDKSRESIYDKVIR